MSGYFTRVTGLLGAAAALLVYSGPAPAQSGGAPAADPVARFYADRDDAPAWTAGAFAELTSAVEHAWTHGLPPARYNFARLTDETLSYGLRDRLATDAYLALAADLYFGVLDPSAIEPDWTLPGKSRDLVAYLHEALESGRVAGSLEALAPQHEEYAALRRELIYLAVAPGGGVAVEPGDRLAPGDAGPRVDQLRAALAAHGAGVTLASPGAPYDAALASAVRRFQADARIDVTGEADTATLAILNRSPADRRAALAINMERWRWLPEDLGARHVRVNIANYRVEAWEGGTRVRTHEAIAGRRNAETPVFSALMTYIVINPWWDAPVSTGLAHLRSVRANPDIARRMGFVLIDRATGSAVDPAAIDWSMRQLTDFHLRQRPGAANALGGVKFMFPNRHNVYLHDTNAPSLFSESRRDISAGCVRVQDPLELTEWVLSGEEGWTRERIDATAAHNRPTTVVLSDPIPVHILYFTAGPGALGLVRHMDDIYRRDPALRAAFESALARPPVPRAPPAPDPEPEPEPNEIVATVSASTSGVGAAR